MLQKDAKRKTSVNELSRIPKEELVAQLLEAQQTIKNLEANYGVPLPSQIDNANDSCDNIVSSYSTDYFSLDCSNFGVNANNSLKSVCNLFNDQDHVMNEVKSRLKGCLINAPSKNNDYDDELVVAYEVTGDFPNCDEDFSLPVLPNDNEMGQVIPKISIPDGGWEMDGDDDPHEETFPLIPSPVLNTPPYEYIFLTKKNEAKYRIFLNQKLNKVFQEELKNLKKYEEEANEQSSDVYLLGIRDESGFPSGASYLGEALQHRHAGTTASHFGQWLPVASINAENFGKSWSIPNVIHCFDPSEVDLELKKIFTEKPPVTHRIVRRKSRKERGSSVPAVDSYYGTRDLHKVGHASYFIPTLTESERKAIGWKPEYHYGHWKYTTLSVPNPNKNLISLHPHVDLEHHNNQHPVSLHQNPLHHHEIDLSEPFVTTDEDDNDSPCQASLCSGHREKQAGGENQSAEIGHSDGLSFITLSGSSPNTQSCHLIPDKSTLRRILRWLIPCAYRNEVSSSTASVLKPESAQNMGQSEDHAEKKTDDSKREVPKVKKQHEIETLVEPSGRLLFPASHTYISFGTTAIPVKDDENRNIAETVDASSARSEVPSKDPNHKKDSPEMEPGAVDPRTHPQQHHSHGMFHWKKILSHGSSRSNESMSVVGGDVIDSVHDHIATSVPHGDFCAHLQVLEEFKEDIAEVESQLKSAGCTRLECAKCFQDSFTESEDSSTEGGSRKKFKTKKLIKRCESRFKLLTLRDLGFETDDDEESEGYCNERKAEVLANDMRSVSMSSSCDTDMSTTVFENGVNPNHPCCDVSPPSGIRQKSLKKQNSGRHRPVVPPKYSSSSSVENDEMFSSASSGFPFDSMNISHQTSHHSDMESVFSDSLTKSSTISERLENAEVVETRFLDPKDTLLSVIRRGIKTEATVSQFAYQFETSHDQEDEVYEFGGDDFDQDMFDWMDNGGDDMNEVAEVPPVLLSCTQTQTSLQDISLSGQEKKKDSSQQVDGQDNITNSNYSPH